MQTTDEIPDGFSASDPTGQSAGGGNQVQANAKEEQRRSLLEQALTPEALARLGTIKVIVFVFWVWHWCLEWEYLR